MSGLNKVMLIGHLGRDPELRSTQDGKRIANINIATSESWKDRNTGERREKTEWHRVVCFNDGLSSVIEQYLKKGSKVYVEGSLRTRKWTDQSGVEKYTTEVVLQAFDGKLVMLDRASGNGGTQRPDESNYQERTTTITTPQQQKPRNQDIDDDIPF